MIELVLEGGALAAIESMDGDRVVLLATAAAPPGALLPARLGTGEGGYRIKVRGCRRDAQLDRFRIEGRFVNLTRADRERLTRG
jgi:hypothetical protein